MKIGAGSGFPYAGQRTPSRASEGSGGASFASTLASVGTTKLDAASVRQTDFTSMTRQEMRDWVNDKIRSGEMSLDDGRPFMAMTMKMPASGGQGLEVPSAGDGERFDFTQKVQDGIEGARSRNDEMTLKMLMSALSFMRKYQGRTVGIDIRA